MSTDIKHYGVKGMRWGFRKGSGGVSIGRYSSATALPEKTAVERLSSSETFRRAQHSVARLELASRTSTNMRNNSLTDLSCTTSGGP